MGTELDLRVVEFDKENKKIVLSAIAALKEKSDEEILEFINTHKLEKVTVDDIKSADAKKFDSSDFDIYDKEELQMPKMPEAPNSEKSDNKEESK